MDYGAEPDYWLVKEDKDGNKDYSQMYDAELIGKAVSEYYGSGYSNEWVKGQWYGNANGWYAKTTYQIDGSVYNFEESGYMVVK